MKKILSCFVVVLFFVTLASSQALPAKVRNYLNTNYKSWRFSTTSNWCSNEYRRAVISGDFDGDRKRDYAVKIIRGRKGYVLAFLERPNRYEFHILHDMSVADIKNTALGVFRKGTSYAPGDEEATDSSSIILKADAPFDGPCASDTGGIHVYRNGRFVSY